jgi:hypothetical protein
LDRAKEDREMTAKEIFEKMKEVTRANTDKIGYVYYIEYTSKNKLTMISKMVGKFEDDSDIDCELGVITHEEHIKEMAMVKAMRDSIKMALDRR